jgi:hypothetical protein
MAIVWSSGSGASNPHYVGIDASTDGSTVWVDYWVRATYAVSDNQTLNRTGDVTGSVNYYLGSPTAIKVSSASFAGTPGQSYAFGAYLSGVYNGGSPSLTVGLTVPIQAPAPPTGVTATYVNDGQINLAWSNTDPYSTSNPYANLIVEWSVDGGLWAAVAVLGVVTSYSATTSADHSYRFRVKARNSSGDSGYAYTSTVYTTPSAPTIGAASKSGTDIVLTFDHTARYPTGAKVYASQDGGAYALLATIATTTETYTHPSPNPAVTWAYKVSATNGSLESALSSASNTVQLEAAPNAPTPLAPLSVRDPAEAIVFQFQHNPADTSGLTAFELQYREQGSGTWITVSTGATEVSSDVWQVTVAGGTLGLDSTYEWQVRTKGAHADWSPWSALGSFPASARPTATINIPTATHGESSLTVTWGYYDAEGTAQSQWRATLTNGTTTEVKSGSGTTGQATFATVLPDASTWDVTVEVRDGAGLWSTPDTVTFTVAYAPPPTPVLTALYNAETGSTALTVTNPAPVAPEVATDHNDLYRSLDAGQTWTLIGEDLPVDGSMVDPLPLVGGSTLYKAVAVSATPSTADSLTVGVDTSDPTVHQSWCYANWGDGFTTGVRLRAGVEVNTTTARAKVMHHYSDRPDPVEYAGSARHQSFNVSARLAPTRDDESTRDELEALADAPAPICWRDPTGRRVFVSSGTVSTAAYGIEETGTVALTRVHHVE